MLDFESETKEIVNIRTVTGKRLVKNLSEMTVGHNGNRAYRRSSMNRGSRKMPFATGYQGIPSLEGRATIGRDTTPAKKQGFFARIFKPSMAV